jgi:hypothetical protein
MIYLIAAVAVWAAGLVLLPVTIWRNDLRANGLNWPGLIVMRRGLRCPGAVWAQEYHEARMRWLMLPMEFAFVLGRLWPRLAFWERWLEIRGHAVEAAAEARLKGSEFSAIYEMREARSMAEYRAFRGWNAQQVFRELRKQRDWARQWADRHIDRIEKMDREGRA